MRRSLCILAVSTLVAALGLWPATTRAQTTLTPEQALARAAAGSAALRASLSDVAAARDALRSAQDARTPVFTAAANGQYAERFSGTSSGVARNSDQSVGGSVGLGYTTAIGTALDFGVDTSVTWRQVNRDPTTTATVSIPPTVTSSVSVGARQPLLRGAGTDAVLASVLSAREGVDQAVNTRDDAASQLVLDVLSAYWELWYAEQSLAVQRLALANAEHQLADARVRSETLGTAPRTDVLRFQSQLVAIRQSVSEAEASRETHALALGNLIGAAPDAAALLEAAADPPASDASAPSTSVLVADARRVSPELLALAASVRAARDHVSSASDAALPRLDLTSSVALGAVWSDDALPGLQLPGGRPAFVGLVGLELELPVGSSAADADLSRARAQLDASEARFEARALSIETQVATLRRNLDANVARVSLATESADVARQLAEAERQRVTLGTSVTSDLVLAQQSERESELARLRALVDQITTRLELDDVTGHLLARYSAPFARGQEARSR